METLSNISDYHNNSIHSALMKAQIVKLNGKSIVGRTTGSTPMDDINPDDRVDHLPIRPKQLPSRNRLSRLSRGHRAAVLIMHIVAPDLEIEAVRWDRFEVTGDAEARKKIARNARRRKTRALARAREFGLWKGGRWQIGNLWMLIDSFESRHANDG